MPRPQVEAFFLPRDEHSLFCLLFSPPAGTPTVGSILHVPAFAEEMNKSRRAVANAARALAMRGWKVMIFDLHGTGDSSGEFGEASWTGWLDDVRHTHAWLERRSESSPVLLGLRVGCLLISELLTTMPTLDVVYWHPVLDGDVALTQMLRLRSMSAAEGDESRKESTRSLREALEHGETLEIAGYDLAPAIALPMRASRLRDDAHAGKRIAWLEVSSAEPPALSPAGARRVDDLRGRGAQVEATAVPGVAFWLTQEIDEAPALVAATVNLPILSR